MMTIRHVLGQKGHNVHGIDPDATVFDALKRMAEHNIGSLAVLENGALLGLITERHYAREVVLKGRTSPGTRVREIMSTRVVFARPVIEDGHLVGLVSIGDMVKSVIADQKFTIEQLEHYIHGHR